MDTLHHGQASASASATILLTVVQFLVVAATANCFSKKLVGKAKRPFFLRRHRIKAARCLIARTSRFSVADTSGSFVFVSGSAARKATNIITSAPGLVFLKGSLLRTSFSSPSVSKTTVTW